MSWKYLCSNIYLKRSERIEKEGGEDELNNVFKSIILLRHIKTYTINVILKSQLMFSYDMT
jgi:hypothetical protein